MSISFSVILLRLGVALVLGVLIGAEREKSEHAAGMRTNALVALGSCLFMLISIYGFSAYITIPHVQFDPSRIASYVVAGIGFLGAGSIFLSREEERVRGLTTAATVWVVAAVGLACGTGMLVEAGTVTVFTLVVLVLLKFLEKLVSPRKAFVVQNLIVETKQLNEHLIHSIYEICTRLQIVVEALDVRRVHDSEVVKLLCKSHDAAALTRAVGALYLLPDVFAVHTNSRMSRVEVGAEKTRIPSPTTLDSEESL